MAEADQPQANAQTEPTEKKPNANGDGDDPRGKHEAFARQPNGDDKNAKDGPPSRKRTGLLVGLALVLVVGTIGGVTYWLHARQYESTDDAFIDGHIVHVAPRVAGRVKCLYVDDNKFVHANDVLIEIDPADYVVRVKQAMANKAQADGALAQANAQLAVAQASADQSHADVLVAEANASNAQSDLSRFQELPPQARSKQQLDNATATFKTTAAQVTAAQKKAAAMDAQVEAARTQIQAAQAQCDQAQAQVDQANLNLSYTKVTADQDGYVTRRSVEVGNYLQVGQEMLAVVPAEVWVTANFKETQLTHMRRDQPVTLEIDAYPDLHLTGKVDTIQAGTGTAFSLLPAENATGNYVKVVQRVPVKIKLDSHSYGDGVVLGVGMSVVPTVKVRD